MYSMLGYPVSFLHTQSKTQQWYILYYLPSNVKKHVKFAYLNNLKDICLSFLTKEN